MGAPAVGPDPGPAVDPEGSRPLVTVLFADVVGSTTMGERLDPEDVTALMNAGYERLLPPITAFGGTVARLMGDGLLALFGAPTMHEDDPERAVRAALAMQAAAAAYRAEVRARFGLDYQIRIGINTGTVVAGHVGSRAFHEYTVMGDTVNTAARLESAAPVGGVRVGPETYRLTRHVVEYGPVEYLTLKGKAEPFPTYCVLGIRDRPLPARGWSGAASPLVGRRAELARLRAAVERALAGEGGIVRLSGEPGSGKSRLLSELRAAIDRAAPIDPSAEAEPDGPGAPPAPTAPLAVEGPLAAAGQPAAAGAGWSAVDARPAGARWAVGRCYSYRQQTPYAALAELLRELFPSSPGGAGVIEGVRSLLAASRARAGLAPATIERGLALLAELLGEGSAPAGGFDVAVAGLSPRDRRDLLAQFLRLLAAALTESAPLVLAVEDAHWLDAASADVLGELLPLLAARARSAYPHGAPRPEADDLVHASAPDRAGLPRGATGGERPEPGARGAPLCVLFTHRPEWTPDWHLPGLVEHIALGRLSDDEARQLARSLLARHGLPADLVEPIVERAGGNPFFVEELVRAAAEAGPPEARGDEAPGASPTALTGGPVVHTGAAQSSGRARAEHLPTTVQEVVLARVDRLEPGARAVLQAGAVVGRRVPEVVLTALADDWLGLPRPELGRALTLLQQQQFVEEEWSAAGRAWQFSHALTQEAIYESLLLARRRRLHGLVGAVIERLYGTTEAIELHLEDLAHHFSLAEDRLPEREKAIRYLMRAGARAARLGATGEAAAYYKRAVDRLRRAGTLADEAERLRCLVDALDGLGEANIDRSRYQAAEEAYCEALGLVGIAPPDAVGAFGGEAAARLATLDSAQLARCADLLKSLGLTWYHRSDWARACAVYRSAAELVAARADPAAGAAPPTAVSGAADGAAALGGSSDGWPPAPPRADPAGATGVSPAGQAAGPATEQAATERAVRQVWAELQTHEGWARLRLGDYEAAEARATAARRVFEAVGDEAGLAHALNLLGALAARRGDAAAPTWYEQALAISTRRGDLRGIASTQLNLANLARRLGQLERAADLYRQALASWEQMLNLKGQVSVHLALGNVHSLRGDLEAARLSFERALRLAEEIADRDGAAIAHRNLGAIFRHRGELDRAADAFGRALAIREAIGDRPGVAQCRNQLGLIHLHRAELDAAQREFEAALAALSALGRREAVAETRNYLGIALFARGRYDAACAEHGAALATFEALGHREGVATSSLRLGMSERARGRLEASRERLRHALASVPELERWVGAPALHAELAAVAAELDDAAGARAYLARGLELAEAAGNSLARAQCLAERARLIALEQLADPAPDPSARDTEEAATAAVALAREAVTLTEAQGTTLERLQHRLTLALALLALAETAPTARVWRPERQRVDHTGSTRTAGRGGPARNSTVPGSAGAGATSREALTEADRLAGAVADEAGAHGLAPLLGEAALVQAGCAAAAGEATRAEALARTAVQALEPIGGPALGRAWLTLARVGAATLGEAERRALVEAACRLFAESGARRELRQARVEARALPVA